MHLAPSQLIKPTYNQCCRLIDLREMAVEKLKKCWQNLGKTLQNPSDDLHIRVGRRILKALIKLHLFIPS